MQTHISILSQKTKIIPPAKITMLDITKENYGSDHVFLPLLPELRLTQNDLLSFQKDSQQAFIGIQQRKQRA